VLGTKGADKKTMSSQAALSDGQKTDPEPTFLLMGFGEYHQRKMHGQTSQHHLCLFCSHNQYPAQSHQTLVLQRFPSLQPSQHSSASAWGPVFTSAPCHFKVSITCRSPRVTSLAHKARYPRPSVSINYNLAASAPLPAYSGHPNSIFTPQHSTRSDGYESNKCLDHSQTTVISDWLHSQGQASVAQPGSMSVLQPQKPQQPMSQQKKTGFR